VEWGGGAKHSSLPDLGFYRVSQIAFPNPRKHQKETRTHVTITEMILIGLFFTRGAEYTDAISRTVHMAAYKSNILRVYAPLGSRNLLHGPIIGARNPFSLLIPPGCAMKEHIIPKMENTNIIRRYGR
jgi:hypothetical protein